MERDDDHFDLDDEFVDADEDQSYEKFIETVGRRARPGSTAKKGKAAWSRLEDVLAERRLQKQLRDFEEDLE